jgi:hypothetical protein
MIIARVPKMQSKLVRNSARDSKVRKLLGREGSGN